MQPNLSAFTARLAGAASIRAGVPRQAFGPCGGMVPGQRVEAKALVRALRADVAGPVRHQLDLRRGSPEAGVEVLRRGDIPRQRPAARPGVREPGELGAIVRVPRHAA